jgi:hypothetical protein
MVLKDRTFPLPVSPAPCARIFSVHNKRKHQQSCNLSCKFFPHFAKFALGVRQFIAAFNDGIYSVPSQCREINFTKKGGNKLPHSMERCHARKSKIHSNIFEITSPLDIPCWLLDIQLKSCGPWPPILTYRNFKVFLIVGTPFRVYHFLNLKYWGQAEARPYLKLRPLAAYFKIPS